MIPRSLLVSAVLVVGGILTKGASAMEPNYPISFNPKQIDCGIVYDTSKSISFSIQYTNVSPSPVSIANFVASCGCSKLIFNKPHLAPGESGQVNLTINPFGKTDSFRITILAKGAARDEVLGVLRAIGFVSDVAKVSPSLLVYRLPAGAIPPTLKLNSRLTLDPNSGDWSLTSVQSDDPHVEILQSSFVPVPAPGPSRAIDCRLLLKCQSPAASWPTRSKINYIFTSAAAQARRQTSQFNLWQDVLILPGSWVTCSPSSVNLLFLGGEKPMVETVHITNRAKSTLSASSTIPALRLALQNPGRESAKLTIEVDPAAFPQSIDGKIYLSDASGQLVATIPVIVTQLSASK